MVVNNVWSEFYLQQAFEVKEQDILCTFGLFVLCFRIKNRQIKKILTF